MLSVKRLEMNDTSNPFSYYEKIGGNVIRLSYKGPINGLVLSDLSHEIRKGLVSDGSANKKLFAVFMELAQNISFYSAEVNHCGNRDRVGTVVVSEDEGLVYLFTGNLVQTQTALRLKKKFSDINHLDNEKLRQYRISQVSKEPEEGSKGAGIGLVKAALVSENNLSVDIKDIDEEHSYVTISVKINKRNSDGTTTDR